MKDKPALKNQSFYLYGDEYVVEKLNFEVARDGYYMYAEYRTYSLKDDLTRIQAFETFETTILKCIRKLDKAIDRVKN